MAIRPLDAYPGQVSGADPVGYPHGRAQNLSVPGDGTGSPLEKDWLNDHWGFLQAILSEKAITPSGTPDKVGASQYLTAIKQIIASTGVFDALLVQLLHDLNVAGTTVFD